MVSIIKVLDKQFPTVAAKLSVGLFAAVVIAGGVLIPISLHHHTPASHSQVLGISTADKAATPGSTQQSTSNTSSPVTSSTGAQGSTATSSPTTKSTTSSTKSTTTSGTSSSTASGSGTGSSTTTTVHADYNLNAGLFFASEYGNGTFNTCWQTHPFDNTLPYDQGANAYFQDLTNDAACTGQSIDINEIAVGSSQTTVSNDIDNKVKAAANAQHIILRKGAGGEAVPLTEALCTANGLSCGRW